MQKYIKNDLSEIRYYEDDVIVGEWLDLDKYRPMTDLEIMKHEAPRESVFHDTWDGQAWVDLRTEQEIKEYERSQLPNLSKRKFQLHLLDLELLDDVENAIEAIEDPVEKRRMQIEYSSSDDFERLSPAVKYMCDLLGWSDDEVDQMWKQALQL